MLQQVRRKIKPKYILLIGFLVLLVLAVLWLRPRVLALYHQVKGGMILTEVMRTYQQNSLNSLACNLPPLENDSARARLQQAIHHLEAARKYNASSSQTYLLLGRVECLLGEPEQAVEAYQNFTRMRPLNPLGHLELSFALAASRKEELAGIELKKAGLSSQSFIEQGNLLRLRSQFNEALWWYELVEQFEPGKDNYWYYYGLVYEGECNLQLAYNAYQRALEYGNTPEAGKSDILYRMGIIGIGLYNPFLAIPNFKEAIQQDNFIDQLTKGDALFRYAVLMEGQGTPASTFIPELQEAIRLNPNHPGAHAMLGTAYYQAYHNITQAIIELEKALAINPWEKWAYIRIANIYFNEKDWEKCAGVFTNLLERFPSDQEVQTALEATQWCNSYVTK